MQWSTYQDESEYFECEEAVEDPSPDATSSPVEAPQLADTHEKEVRGRPFCVNGGDASQS
jgi:hypothetical protein